MRPGAGARPAGTGRRLALALVALAGLPSCSAAPAPRAAEPVVQVTGMADLVLPFDAYKPTAGHRALLADAHAGLLAQCMRRHGFTVSPPPADATKIARTDPGNSRRYGVADPEHARRYGYHLAPSDPAGPAWHDKLSPAARHRLYDSSGRPGCMSEASAMIAGGAPKADWRWLALQDSRSLDEAATQPAVTEATERWRACMERAGLRYPTPEAAVADRRWRLEKAAITAGEKRTASADTACKWSSGLVAAWFAADAALQRVVIAAEPERFAMLRANLRHRLSRASAVTDR
ncbi:hypothetical protein [Nonomuraea cavernae]|uniref:hypothetical protein n=1 Tax=Nonomuraea cavernae TaxID=2045107 RepID=UPI0033FBBE1D